MRPDLMQASPDEAAPGDVVALTFPEETSRGVAFVLERRVGDTWDLRYFLFPGHRGGRGPSWRTPAEDVGWPDVGVGGPVPTGC
jgi:hypothetical protein